MKDKFQKERLTEDNIKLDLLDQLRPFPLAVEILLVVMLLALFGLGIFHSFTVPLSKPIYYFRISAIVFFSVAFLVYIPISVYLRSRLRKKRRMVQNGDFDIVLDRLTVAGEVERFKGGVHEKFNFFDFFIFDRHKYQIWFQFARYGDYYLPLTKMYRWSERYCMSSGGVTNTSLIGDSFYLVVYKNDPKHTPLMIYSTKLFELNDEYIDLQSYVFDEED